MGEREPISGADNSWRRMGTIDNLTTITGVLTFDEELTYDEFCDQLERRLLRFDRFKQRLGGRKRKIRRSYWEEVEDFDINTHVYEVNLAEPKNKEKLQQFVGTLMSRPLDERRPLWEAYLLQEYEEGSAVAFRLDHSMADGFALLYVLFGLADNPEAIEFPIPGLSTPELPEEERAASAEANGGTGAVTADKSATDVETTVGEQPTDGIGSDESSATGEADDTDDTDDASDTDAGSGGPGLMSALKTAATAVEVTLDLLLMTDEPQTSLHDEIGTTKTAAWTEEMSLETIKEIGEAHDATVNDVMLGATAGVFHRIMESRGEDTDGLDLRCTVPVNLKPMDARDESLGNYFGLSFVPIPVDDRDLDDRISTIRERADVRRLGVQAYIMYQVLTVGGHIPEQLFDVIVPEFEDNATAVVSNVPGPVDSIEIAGKEVNEIMFWNPQALDQGLSVSIFTYNGTVQVGISGDANLIPEPGKLTEAFEEEVARLAERYAA